MNNIHNINTFLGDIPVRVMQLESLGWAACVYTSAEGRKGEYVFADTYYDALGELAMTLRGV